ncbi:hypothetical protein BXZ70DRAFT_1079838 [Cristinia sonorae]|uniref:F-box domain-containing protein n=1 Tax=Cristinia sonorae TaxID=1940300 RepID=A0A8K0XLN7_9AGAR|nr:hypothetical protein BXZ70DRAFT_1079838 [Cristinia sonorae]
MGIMTIAHCNQFIFHDVVADDEDLLLTEEDDATPLSTSLMHERIMDIIKNCITVISNNNHPVIGQCYGVDTGHTTLHPSNGELTLRMEEPETPWAPPYGLPRLPVEVWERVIDHLADDAPSRIRSSLIACSLVCRFWVSRSRYHLCTHDINLRSNQSLLSFEQYLKSSRELPPRIFRLIISTKPGDDQSWVSSAPIRLPKLPNLNHLVLDCIDLSLQNVHFWRNFTLFACQYLELIGVRYSRHLTLSRVVSSIQPKQLRLEDLKLVEGTILNPGQRLSSCGDKFKWLELVHAVSEDWEDATTLFQGWTMSGPALHKIQISVHWGPASAPTEGSFLKEDVWRSLAHMFQPTCRTRDADITPMSVSIQTTFFSVNLDRDLHGDIGSPGSDRAGLEDAPPIVRQVLELTCEEESSSSLIQPVIINLASCRFDAIVLKVAPKLWASSALWKTLDDELSRPRYATLACIDLIPNWTSWSMEWLDSDQCPNDVQFNALPKCASRGILRTDCEEWGCGVHGGADMNWDFS